MPSTMTLHFDSHAMRLLVGEGGSSFGVDVQAPSRAPGGEGIGVDVCLDSDTAAADMPLSVLLGLVLPHEESRRQRVSIGEKRFQSVVVRLLVPDETGDGDFRQ